MVADELKRLRRGGSEVHRLSDAVGLVAGDRLPHRAGGAPWLRWVGTDST